MEAKCSLCKAATFKRSSTLVSSSPLARGLIFSGLGCAADKLSLVVETGVTLLRVSLFK